MVCASVVENTCMYVHVAVHGSGSVGAQKVCTSFVEIAWMSVWINVFAPVQGHYTLDTMYVDVLVCVNKYPMRVCVYNTNWGLKEQKDAPRDHNYLSAPERKADNCYMFAFLGGVSDCIAVNLSVCTMRADVS